MCNPVSITCTHEIPNVKIGYGNVSQANSENSQSNSHTVANNEKERGDTTLILNELKAKIIDRPISACININFFETKFEPLNSIIKDKVEILFVSETKLDDTFPTTQFLIEGYSPPIRLDRNCHGGGIMTFFRDDLPHKELKSHKLPNNVEVF